MHHTDSAAKKQLARATQNRQLVPVHIHFENIDSLVGYLEDEALQAKAADAMSEAADILGGDVSKIHRQNFVVDDM